jgi:hypothetical protein
LSDKKLSAQKKPTESSRELFCGLIAGASPGDYDGVGFEGLLSSLQQLLPEDRDIARRFNPKPNFAAVDVNHCNTNVVVDNDLLA